MSNFLNEKERKSTDYLETLDKLPCFDLFGGTAKKTQVFISVRHLLFISLKIWRLCYRRKLYLHKDTAVFLTPQVQFYVYYVEFI